MCGIVGYIGTRETARVLIDGLRRLEYRGYDSAGIAVFHRGKIEIRRKEGKLSNLEELIGKETFDGKAGIGHTRWATHGRPSDENAHPHKAGKVAVVHNGIIENYLPLKEFLKKKGHVFSSETDTEIVAHLVDEFIQEGHSFLDAVRITMDKIKGSYALGILYEGDETCLIGARKEAPLVIALGEKGGYKHFMLKEIFEQPRAVTDTIRGRLSKEHGDGILEEIHLDPSTLKEVQRSCLSACGTSYHAALVGKFLIEGFCRVPVEADIGSEFRYRNPIVRKDDLLVAISQSGETAERLAALREGKRQGASTLAICNVVESSLARDSDYVIYTHAGPEIGVASTKTFVTQLVTLFLLGLRIGRELGVLSSAEGKTLIEELVRVPHLMEELLKTSHEVAKIARKYLHVRDFLYLGRGINYPIALEGALKLKEISYVHAEGYPAGEMKHGPIALIDREMPVVTLVTKNEVYDKVLSNIEEVKAREGKVIALASQSDREIVKKVDDVIFIPETHPSLTPILLTIPLQLLAYYMADFKGTDVDQPRNLAKRVTVA